MNEKQYIEANREQNQYAIVESRLFSVRTKIEKLNKRAARIGCAPITLVELGEAEPFTTTNELTKEVVAVQRRIVFQLAGETPKFAGWTLAATIEHTPEGNILRTVPSFAGSLAEYRDAKCKCDHCRTDRNRRDSHIVIHDDGTRKQVGSNCIADFLGHTNPKSIMALAELWAGVGECCSEGEFEEGSGRDRVLLCTDGFLALIARLIRRDGYVSGTKAREDLTGRTQSTKDDAMWYLFPPSNLTSTQREEIRNTRPEPQDDEFAAKAREFVLATDARAAELSDFEHNLLVAAKCEYLELRTLGIAAYIVEHYRRNVETAREQMARPNVHFGAVGTRYKSLKATWYGCLTSFDTQYGTSYLYKFILADTGAVCKWFSSTEQDIAKGAEVIVDFTVKEHGEFKGWNETMVTRAKVATEEELAEQAAHKARMKADRKAAKASAKE